MTSEQRRRIKEALIEFLYFKENGYPNEKKIAREADEHRKKAYDAYLGISIPPYSSNLGFEVDTLYAQIMHIMIQDVTPEQQKAILKMNEAIGNKGPNPTVHEVIMEEHRRQWPTLWKAIDGIQEAFKGQI